MWNQYLHWIKEPFLDAAKSGDYDIRDPEFCVVLLAGGIRRVVLFPPKRRPGGLVERFVRTFLSESRTLERLAQSLSSASLYGDPARRR